MDKKTATLIGLDIGGTKIEGILWRNGHIVRAKKIPTPHTKKRFFAILLDLIGELGAGYAFQGIGLGLAGSLNARRGILIRNANLRFLEGADFFRAIKKRFHKPLRMDNDANCFVRGEVNFGRGRGLRNVIGLTLGTGVGGGIYLNGELLLGAHNSAGELGHMLLGQEKGEYINLEHLVSGRGFKRLGVNDPLRCQIKALAGNKRARAVYQKIGRYLGAGLASLANIFDPEIIILGGGITRGAKLFLPAAQSEMKKYLLSSRRPGPPVRVSKLKWAGALGAVSLFFT